MCKYRSERMCTLTNSNCPWAYWCGNVSGYKERESYKKYCKFIKEEENKIPDGYYKVEFVRRGYLYIKYKDDEIIKVKNSFDEIPKFVKVKKYKASYKVAV